MSLPTDTPQQADYQHKLVGSSKNAAVHSRRQPGREIRDQSARDCIVPASALGQYDHEVRDAPGPNPFGHTTNSENFIDYLVWAKDWCAFSIHRGSADQKD